VTGEWRKLHNEQLKDLYCSPNIVREELDGRTCSTCGEEERSIQGFCGVT